MQFFRILYRIRKKSNCTHAEQQRGRAAETNPLLLCLSVALCAKSFAGFGMNLLIWVRNAKASSRTFRCTEGPPRTARSRVNAGGCGTSGACCGCARQTFPHARTRRTARANTWNCGRSGSRGSRRSRLRSATAWKKWTRRVTAGAHARQAAEGRHPLCTEPSARCAAHASGCVPAVETRRMEGHPAPGPSRRRSRCTARLQRAGADGTGGVGHAHGTMTASGSGSTSPGPSTASHVHKLRTMSGELCFVQ
jgi:hypothetical protein